MSRVQKFLLFLVLIVLFYNFIKGKEVAHADAYASGDVSCVANGVIDYVNGFFTAAPAYQHIKFITPVFNVGEPNFNALITQIINGTGANWNKFDFEGANAYDTADGKLVMAYVNESYDKYALNKPMILTETGWHDYYAGAVSRDVAKTKLAGQISAIGGDSRIQAALLFNALGTGSSEWDAFRLSTSGPDEFAEIGANNGKIGANSASHYTSGDGFYSTANQKGLKYTLEIANDDQVGVLAGVKSAHNNAMIPIIRIGYGDPSSSTSGGFDDPAHYAAFLKYIDDNVGSDPEQTVYAIIGPNEPNAERWASHGACNDSSYSGGNGTIKIRGQVRTSKNIVLPTGARVTGGYVQGVKVVAYEGVSPTISETCKDNGDLKNLSHNLGGGINISTTDRFGYFELTLNRDSGCNKTNYLIFYAGASANPADNLIDMWKVPTTDNYEPLRINVNVDVSVKNDADGPYFSIDTPSDPPDPYNYLNRADILSCYTPAMGMTPTIYEALKKTFIVSKGITTRLGLKFDDHSYDNSGNPGSDVPLEGDDRTTSIPLYGREDQTNESVSIANLIATTTCTIWGCVAPIVMPRYDKKFPVQEISQCSDYQQSTSPVPVEGSNSPINSRYYGPAVNLSDPNVVTSAKLSSVGKYYLANYATQLKCMAVCKDSSVTSQDECYNAASGLPATGVVYMHNIQPPWFKDPEVVSLTGVNPDCLVGSGGCYLKDVSYFPYALVTGTRFFGEGQGETTTNSDSFNSPARRDKQFPDDPSTSKELTLSESDGTDKAFTSGPTAVIYQGTNGDASPIPASTAVNNKVLNINGVDEIIAPPTDVISDPKFGDQPDPAQGAPSIQKKYSLRSAGNGGLVRIGRPDNLCVKSNFDAQEGTRIFNLWGLGADPSPDHQPYTAGYSFVTSKNILSIGCDSSSNQFFCWPVDLLTAVIQAITSFFTTGWTTHTNNTAGKTCGGFNHTPSDNECASGDINCSCLNGVITEDPQTLRLSCSDPNGWHKTQVWIQQYTCSGVVQTKPFIVDNKLPLPIKGLATGMQNFCLALGMGPDDDNTGALAGGSIDVNATNQASFKEGFGSDVIWGEDMSYIVDKFCYNAEGDPVFGGPVFKERNLSQGIRKAPIVPAEVGACYLGRTDGGYGEITGSLPDYLVQILERAAFVNDIPAALMVSYLYTEGAFHKYPELFDDGAVMAGSAEGATFGNCDPTAASAQGPFDWLDAYWKPPISDAVKDDFPNRTPFRCNLLDQAYATAKRLAQSAQGAGSYGHNDCVGGVNCNKCYGFEYSSTRGSCEHWTIQNTISASRGIAGFCWDNQFSAAGGGNYANPDCSHKDPTTGQRVTTTPDLCRETYQNCSTGLNAHDPPNYCSSLQYSFNNIFERYKNPAQ